MSTLQNKPAHWHLRAQEPRVLAEHITDPIAKAGILKTSEEYDRLALRAALRMQDQDERTAG
jgi:hypothetical protein